VSGAILSVTRNYESAIGHVVRRRAVDVVRGGREIRVLDSRHVGWLMKSNNGRGIE
jgi:hypothetical protein